MNISREIINLNNIVWIFVQFIFQFILIKLVNDSE